MVFVFSSTPSLILQPPANQGVRKSACGIISHAAHVLKEILILLPKAISKPQIGLEGKASRGFKAERTVIVILIITFRLAAKPSSKHCSSCRT